MRYGSRTPGQPPRPGTDVLVLVALLLYAALVWGFGGRLLANAEWVVRAPVTAIVLWHACALAFLLAVVGALALMAHDAWEYVIVRVFHATEATSTRCTSALHRCLRYGTRPC